MNRCKKHRWITTEFIGDPGSYVARVRSTCDCGKIKERAATWDERNAEILRRSCGVCGLPKSLHPVEDIDPRDCISLLSNRLKELENRLESLENWRNS
jgi:hypothetical protein